LNKKTGKTALRKPQGGVGGSEKKAEKGDVKAQRGVSFERGDKTRFAERAMLESVRDREVRSKFF